MIYMICVRPVSWEQWLIVLCDLIDELFGN